MAMIRFVCTLCGEEIDVRDELAGRQIKCSKCNSICLVPDKSPRMKFHCHSCGQSVRVERIHAGKKGICPKCRKLIDIPPHPEGTMVALVCPICNEIIHVPEDSKEKLIECPNCGSYIEGLSKED